MLNIFMYYTPPQFYPVSSCKHVVENSVDPDQGPELQCLLRVKEDVLIFQDAKNNV